MAVQTSYRAAPSFFHQGPSALARLLVFSALAVGLMMADRQWAVAVPLRNAVATVLYPIQWTLTQPLHAWQSLRSNMVSLQAAQTRSQQLATDNLVLRQQSQRAAFLAFENTQLREMLALQARVTRPTLATEVAYRVADPYSQRVVIRRGTQAGVQEGAAVMDAYGVYGQITHAYPFSSEVTLLTDDKQHTPVMSMRSGATGVLVGSNREEATLEFKFLAITADLQVGDTLVTNGMDGVYPEGLPVATIVRIDRAPSDDHAELVLAKPMARVHDSRYLMVILPGNDSAQPQATSQNKETSR